MPTPGEHGPEQQQAEPRGRSAVEAEASSGHRPGAGSEREDAIGAVPARGVWAGMATAIVPVGPAPETPQRQDAAATRFLKFCEMVPK